MRKFCSALSLDNPYVIQSNKKQEKIIAYIASVHVFRYTVSVARYTIRYV
jgi:hypothetical protein